MGKFRIILSPRAARDLDDFSDAVYEKIVLALRVLGENPFPRGKLVKKIKGKNSDYYRLRTDKYRIFYRIESNDVVVLAVLSKKNAERFIRNMF
ncbi:MAG TPA: type II toxin-antitoxin system RelE/ParE family toxin [Dissulfurispiraceae bacterium]